MYEQRFNPYAANIAIVKDYFKSGKVLAMGILYIVSLVLSVLTLLTRPVDALLYQYLDAMERLGIDTSALSPSTYSSAMYGAKAGMIMSAVVSSVIMILAAAAFMILFAKSRSQNPDSSPVAGAGILYVLAMIRFVCAIILTIFAGIFYVVVAIISLSRSTDGAAVAILAISGIVLTIVLFFLIFITASNKNYYRSVKYSLTTVKLQSKGAAVIGVFSVIGAVLYGFTLIGDVVLAVRSGFTLVTLLSLLTVLVTFLTLILNASIALGYNSHIKKHTLGYGNAPYNNGYIPMPQNQPVYQQPTYQDYQNPAPYQTPQNGFSQQNPYSDNFSGEEAPAQEPRSAESKPAYCPNCGAPSDGSSVFCSNCGHKL